MSEPTILPTQRPPRANTISGRAPAASEKPERDRTLRAMAEQLEATFLSEMLNSAGLGKSRESFGGGVGEDQFASFLRDAQAKEMVKAGGIGLAESLYQALKERPHEH